MTTRRVNQRNLRRADHNLIDPVAVMRSANGDRKVYDAMSIPEQRAMWEFVYARDFHYGCLTVGRRLGLKDSGSKYAGRAAERIARGVQATIPDLDMWEGYYNRMTAADGLPGSRELGTMYGEYAYRG